VTRDAAQTQEKTIASGSSERDSKSPPYSAYCPKSKERGGSQGKGEGQKAEACGEEEKEEEEEEKVEVHLTTLE